MKKLLLTITLIISVLMLSSCKVNWFGESFDVPWYCVVIPVVLLFVIVYAFIISRTYVCPECKTEFKPKWYQLYACIHLNGERLNKCPHCGRKGFCKIKK